MAKGPRIDSCSIARGNATCVRRGATRSLNCLSAPASVACCHDDDERFEGDFQMTGKAFGIALIAAFMLLAANGLAKAATAGEINASVNATLDRFYRQIPGARELSARAAGVLVFPTVLKAGFGVGGEYGEGAMRVGGKTVGYYNTVAVVRLP